MGDTGSPYNLRFPELADAPNVPQDMEELATDAHDQFAVIDAALALMIPTLISTPDGGFPVGVTDETTGVHVANRITLSSVAYPRLLIINGHTMARYSQGQGVQCDIFVNSTVVSTYRPGSSAVETYESYIPHGQFKLPASTAGVVELRFVRVGGTGQFDVNVAAGEARFQVSYQRCVA
jgi:hypothetical protein